MFVSGAIGTALLFGGYIASRLHFGGCPDVSL